MSVIGGKVSNMFVKSKIIIVGLCEVPIEAAGDEAVSRSRNSVDEAVESEEASSEEEEPTDVEGEEERRKRKRKKAAKKRLRKLYRKKVREKEKSTSVKAASLDVTEQYQYETYSQYANNQFHQEPQTYLGSSHMENRGRGNWRQYHNYFSREQDYRPYHRRRSHLDDVFLPNYEDNDLTDHDDLDFNSRARHQSKRKFTRWSDHSPYKKESTRKHCYKVVSLEKDRSNSRPSFNKENTTPKEEEEAEEKDDSKSELKSSANNKSLEVDSGTNECDNPKEAFRITEGVKTNDEISKIDSSACDIKQTEASDTSESKTPLKSNAVEDKSRPDKKSVDSSNANKNIENGANVDVVTDTSTVQCHDKDQIEKTDDKTNPTVSTLSCESADTDLTEDGAKTPELTSEHFVKLPITPHMNSPKISLNLSLKASKPTSPENKCQSTDATPLPTYFPTWENLSEESQGIAVIDSDQETVCFDDFITIDKIDTTNSFLVRLDPCMDDYRVVDMDMGTPSPIKRKNYDDSDNLCVKKSRVDRLYAEINSDELLSQINDVLNEDKQKSETKNVRRYRSKSLNTDDQKLKTILPRSKSVGSLDKTQCHVGLNFDLKTNLLFLLSNRNREKDDGLKIVKDTETTEATVAKIIPEQCSSGTKDCEENQEATNVKETLEQNSSGNKDHDKSESQDDLVKDIPQHSSSGQMEHNKMKRQEVPIVKDVAEQRSPVKTGIDNSNCEYLSISVISEYLKDIQQQISFSKTDHDEIQHQEAAVAKDIARQCSPMETDNDKSKRQETSIARGIPEQRCSGKIDHDKTKCQEASTSGKKDFNKTDKRQENQHSNHDGEKTTAPRKDHHQERRKSTVEEHLKSKGVHPSARSADGKTTDKASKVGESRRPSVKDAEGERKRRSEHSLPGKSEKLLKNNTPQEGKPRPVCITLGEYKKTVDVSKKIPPPKINIDADEKVRTKPTGYSDASEFDIKMCKLFGDDHDLDYVTPAVDKDKVEDKHKSKKRDEKEPKKISSKRSNGEKSKRTSSFDESSSNESSRKSKHEKQSSTKRSTSEVKHSSKQSDKNSSKSKRIEKGERRTSVPASFASNKSISAENKKLKKSISHNESLSLENYISKPKVPLLPHNKKESQSKIDNRMVDLKTKKKMSKDENRRASVEPTDKRITESPRKELDKTEKKDSQKHGKSAEVAKTNTSATNTVAKHSTESSVALQPKLILKKIDDKVPIVNPRPVAERIHFSLISEVPFIKCTILCQERFPTRQKARCVQIENECCDEAVVLESPEILSDIVVAKQNIPLSTVEKEPEVVEIKPEIPIIDLTDDDVEVRDATSGGSTQNDSANCKDKNDVDLDLDALAAGGQETITLYRSDETLNNNLEVQAMVASLTPETLNNSKDGNKCEVKTDDADDINRGTPITETIRPLEQSETEVSTVVLSPPVSQPSANESGSEVIFVNQSLPNGDSQNPIFTAKPINETLRCKHVGERRPSIESGSNSRTIYNSSPQNPVGQSQTTTSTVLTTGTFIPDISQHRDTDVFIRPPPAHPGTARSRTQVEGLSPRRSGESPRRTDDHVSLNSVTQSPRRVDNSSQTPTRTEERIIFVSSAAQIQRGREVYSVPHTIDAHNLISIAQTPTRPEECSVITSVAHTPKRIDEHNGLPIVAQTPRRNDEYSVITTVAQTPTRIEEYNVLPIVAQTPRRTEEYSVLPSAGQTPRRTEDHSIPSTSVTQSPRRVSVDSAPPMIPQSPRRIENNVVTLVSVQQVGQSPRTDNSASNNIVPTSSAFQQFTTILLRYLYFLDALKKAQIAYAAEMTKIVRILPMEVKQELKRFEDGNSQHYYALSKNLVLELGRVHVVATVDYRTMQSFVEYLFHCMRKNLPNLTLSWVYLMLYAMMESEVEVYMADPFLKVIYTVVECTRRSLQCSWQKRMPDNAARDVLSSEQRKTLLWQIGQYKTICANQTKLISYEQELQKMIARAQQLAQSTNRQPTSQGGASTSTPYQNTGLQPLLNYCNSESISQTNNGTLQPTSAQITPDLSNCETLRLILSSKGPTSSTQHSSVNYPSPSRTALQSNSNIQSNVLLNAVPASQPSASKTTEKGTAKRKTRVSKKSTQPKEDFRIRLPLTMPYDMVSTPSTTTIAAQNTAVFTSPTLQSPIQSLAQNAPPSLQALCPSPVYAPLLVCPVINRKTPETAEQAAEQRPEAPTSPTDSKPEAQLEAVKLEAEFHALSSEMETIDLTWVDEIDPEQLHNEIECITIKKEEPADEEEEEEEKDEENLNQDPLVPSPADSGVASPPMQMEFNEQVFSNRTCICGKPAEYICGCMMAMYCSDPCQLRDWKTHKEVCLKHKAKISNKDGVQNHPEEDDSKECDK